MAGIYIHIPYCRQACTYCDFHFSTNLSTKNDLLEAIHTEIDLRKDYLKGQEIETVYFGGGTPSVLSSIEIKSILDHLQDSYSFQHGFECTLEANPDDLNPNYLDALIETQINRLSIGIQSFYEEDMKYMHRSHTPQQSLDAIHNARRIGFQKLSIDLIYGSPTTGQDHWKKNLDIAFDLDLAHLSCYALTVEPKTILANQIKKRNAKGPDDHETIHQLEYLMDVAPDHGFEQYEISNFAKEGHRSKHNSSYWRGEQYIGFGPAAHSFDGLSRQWNVANNNQYIQLIKNEQSFFEIEILNDIMKYNEYILTRLRTIEGVSMHELKEPFKSHVIKQSNHWANEKFVVLSDQSIQLTRKGKFIADRISADLFFAEEI
ncbi:MAG: radical SAM family heme chaperone HemW [Saprospiraceae bacterium]